MPTAFSFLPAMLRDHAPIPYKTHHLGKWHLGFFSDAHVPAGRGFDTSFGFMLGQSSHDNRSSQVTHTCHDPVKDLYNTSHIADDTLYATNNVYDEAMYAAEASRIISAHEPAKGPFFLCVTSRTCVPRAAFPQTDSQAVASVRQLHGLSKLSRAISGPPRVSCALPRDACRWLAALLQRDGLCTR